METKCRMKTKGEWVALKLDVPNTRERKQSTPVAVAKGKRVEKVLRKNPIHRFRSGPVHSRGLYLTDRVVDRSEKRGEWRVVGWLFPMVVPLANDGAHTHTHIQIRLRPKKRFTIRSFSIFTFAHVSLRATEHGSESQGRASELSFR